MATLRSDLSRLALKAPELASEVLLETAAVVVDVAKQLSPVDTGALQQSIGADPVDAHTVQIGSDMPYAAAVEFGRPDIPNYPAQPYLIPALAQSEETFKTIFEKKFKGAL